MPKWHPEGEQALWTREASLLSASAESQSPHPKPQKVKEEGNVFHTASSHGGCCWGGGALALRLNEQHHMTFCFFVFFYF